MLDLIVKLTNNVAAIEEAMAIFDAVADRANEVNAAGLGPGFRCIQSAATDSMIVGCGRLVDTSRRKVSFNELHRTLKASQVKNPTPLIDWLAIWQRGASSSSRRDALRDQFRDSFRDLLAASSEKVVELRHKFVAHRAPDAEWEAVGASFPDVERTIKLAYETIDATTASFLDFTSASTVSRQGTKRNLAGIKEVVDRALAAKQAAL